MGIFDRFTKKKKEKQLKALEQKGASSVLEKKEEKKTVSAPAVTSERKKLESKKAGKKESARPARGADASSFPRMHQILRHPLISEKATLGEARGTYTFVVADDATKADVKNAIRALYNVVPTKVRMINVAGKQVRFGRTMGKRKDWKKAMVTLPKGASISIHEGI